MFPEPVYYMRTDSPGWHIRDWETANKLLSYLEPTRRHFAIFTLPDNSFVQCLGRKTALTVEARVQKADGSFVHFVFGKGPLTQEDAQVGGENGMVTVDKSQVLRMRDARLIIREFLEKRTFSSAYEREDVSSRLRSA